MLIKTIVDPNKIKTYHELGPNENKVDEIKQRTNYNEVKSSLDKDGQYDPIIIRCEPDRVFVECGERRIFAARELGWKTVDALAYNTLGRKSIPFEGIVLETKDDAISSTSTISPFIRETLTVTVSGVCPSCGHDSGSKEITQEVPARKMIREYIDAGIIKTESLNNDEKDL